MALTGQQLLDAFGFGYAALGFNSEASAVSAIEAEGGALPAAQSMVNVPVRSALKSRAVSVEAAIALAYPNNPDAQAVALGELQPLLTSAQKRFGLSLLNGSVVSTSPDWITRSNEFRIAANQDLAKAIELLAGIVALIPAPDALEAQNAHSGSVRVRPVFW